MMTRLSVARYSLTFMADLVDFQEPSASGASPSQCRSNGRGECDGAPGHEPRRLASGASNLALRRIRATFGRDDKSAAAGRVKDALDDDRLGLHRPLPPYAQAPVLPSTDVPPVPCRRMLRQRLSASRACFQCGSPTMVQFG